jgi:hypothetical protein
VGWRGRHDQQSAEQRGRRRLARAGLYGKLGRLRLLGAGASRRARVGAPAVRPSGWACGVVFGIGSGRGRDANGTEATSDGTDSRPVRIWQVKALPSCMLTFGSVTIDVRSFAGLPATSPAQPKWIGKMI